MITNGYGTCPVEVVYNPGTANEYVVELGDVVTYSEEYTPICSGISPLYGSVRGGTTITISGENFSTNTADYEIIIDGIVCEA